MRGIVNFFKRGAGGTKKSKKLSKCLDIDFVANEKSARGNSFYQIVQQ